MLGEELSLTLAITRSNKNQQNLKKFKSVHSPSLPFPFFDIAMVKSLFLKLNILFTKAE